MKLLRTLLTNHPLVNIFFVVVLVMGSVSYLQLPREQDPEVNFNFVNINTVLPGATAADVEELVTGPLEDALRNVQDIRFVSSSSRENVSDILVRFNELTEREFDKRVVDLRREIQSKTNDELPDDVEDPYVLEVTTSNGFPTATVIVAGQADDERLRRQAKIVRDELERLTGVDRVQAFGFNEPELQVEVDPQALAANGLTATDVADQLREAYRDVTAGEMQVGDEAWLIRVEGKTVLPEELAQFLVSPKNLPQSKIALDRIAEIRRGRQEEQQLVSFNGRPAVSMSITKVAFTNTLELVDGINQYVDQRNRQMEGTGIDLYLADDQTTQTREALSVMQRNALLGLFLVLAVCWIFLGIRIAFFVTLGIAFSIAGTFWLLNISGNTLNVPVLLGIVIVLGMLVDDAVVIVEAMYYRLQRGEEALQASLDALREVGQPVTAAVFTTISAFAPLMLLPGILGDFMKIIPLVVTTGLLVSLIEAFWILPSHVITSTSRVQPASERFSHWRGRWTHLVRVRYTRALAYVFRRPKRFFLAGLLAFALSIVAVATEQVRVEFFTFDPFRLFYVHVEMPPEAPLEDTLAQAERVEQCIRTLIEEDEIRAITVMAGVKFTDAEALFGDQYGQIQVSLMPKTPDNRAVGDIVDAIRDVAMATPGNAEVSFFEVSGGPPVAKDVSVKVRGDDFEELRAAAEEVKRIVSSIEGSSNVIDNDVPGRYELALLPDLRAIRQAGLAPGEVLRLLRLHLDGEIVAFTRDGGEKVELRVRGPRRTVEDASQILADPVALPGGGTTTLGALTSSRIERGSGTIRHYNFRRSITVEADLDDEVINQVAATNLIIDEWEQVRRQYPEIVLDFSGAFDDIQESLDSLLILGLFGVGLIYLILATQFRSYFQPLLILVTLPMAFTGVIVGLWITRNPLSLYTLYGIVALAGIAVNAAIVLIDAANTRIRSGMRPLHAIIYAARRRVIPILMTTLTTIAGLFSLATGLGGKSLLWGPVATSMVSGLFVATLLTLFLMPILFRTFMRLRDHRIRAALFHVVQRGKTAIAGKRT
ncbi:MAG TPA: efflux RND transporter permease subunit [Woeseiaceae bacterium]|nr:efflux RND transporter permease subunit [Woeseiaceae bacterium]